jgi:hypothetical protein
VNAQSPRLRFLFMVSAIAAGSSSRFERAAALAASIPRSPRTINQANSFGSTDLRIRLHPVSSDSERVRQQQGCAFVSRRLPT